MSGISQYLVREIACHFLSISTVVTIDKDGKEIQFCFEYYCLPW